MNSAGTITESNIRLVDDYLKVAIALNGNCNTIVRYPIETVSMSEGGFERVFQGSIVMPMWDIELRSEADWNGSLLVKFEALP
jgi:alpha-amylase